jgi:hypothetical protein
MALIPSLSPRVGEYYMGPMVEPAGSMYSHPVSAAGFDEIRRSTVAPEEQTARGR